MSGLRVIVTGAAGFVGAATVRRFLGSGDTVLAWVRPESDLSRLAGLSSNASLFSLALDIAAVLDPRGREAALEAVTAFRPDVVVHAAWRGIRGASRDHPTQVDNVALAMNLMRVCAEAGARRAESSLRRDGFRATLAAVRGERQIHERAAAEADAQSRKLAEFIEALPPSRSGSAPYTGFAALRGRLPRPAGSRIDVGFGKVVDPRFRTVTVQKGVDIAARRGEEVLAVAPGRVVHAGWFKGYGNLVIVDHGEGFHTLVAHLASMTAAAGEDVEAGAILGTVGDTGSLKGAYLYFEIREHGKPLDPKAWLVP